MIEDDDDDDAIFAEDGEVVISLGRPSRRAGTNDTRKTLLPSLDESCMTPEAARTMTRQTLEYDEAAAGRFCERPVSCVLSLCLFCFNFVYEKATASRFCERPVTFGACVCVLIFFVDLVYDKAAPVKFGEA